MRAARLLAGTATALTGLATTASSLSPDAPPRRRLLEAIEPDSAHAAAHALGALGGVLVVGLAAGVLAGRRAPARGAVVALGVLAVVHLAKGLDYEEAALGLAVALALRRLLSHATPSRAMVAALTALAGIGAGYTATLVVLLLTGRSADLSAGALRSAETVAGAAPPVGTGLKLAIGLSVGALLLALRELVAPAGARDGHDVAEHARAASLVTAYGDDSIAPFALRADKAFHF